MGMFADLLGTSGSFFKIGITGVRLKNNSGNLVVRNNADSADASLTTSQLNNSGNTIVINSDAAGSGADWTLSLNRPSSGMTADVSLTFPVDDGTAGQVLSTDGTGVMSWVSAADTALCDKLNSTTLNFGDTSPVSLMTTGANDIIDLIEIIVDTPFDGTPSTVSVGIVGTTSKYASVTQSDLSASGATVFQIHPGLDAQGSEALIATYSDGGATAGSARVIIHYATPA
jgi:hypothetical protein